MCMYMCVYTGASSGAWSVLHQGSPFARSYVLDSDDEQDQDEESSQEEEEQSESDESEEDSDGYASLTCQ